ncbi:MAG: sulfur carrier protein ThiS [Aromatoleum sp.]|nr:sulfur carrier protein ThiS [Aromatoleum sp.]
MPDISLNGRPRGLSPGASTVMDLVRELQLEGKRIAVERNGEIVPRSRYKETQLVDGDKLEIVGAVGGG